MPPTPSSKDWDWHPVIIATMTSMGAKTVGKRNFKAILPISQKQKNSAFRRYFFTACYGDSYG
jgi:hypothetical protein